MTSHLTISHLFISPFRSMKIELNRYTLVKIDENQTFIHLCQLTLYDL